MPSKPASDSAVTRPTPITLDELVDRVLGAPSGRKKSRSEQRGGLGARIRSVLSGRAAADAPAPVQDSAHTDTDSGRSAWGLAPTEEVRRLMGLPSASGWVPSLNLAPVVAAVNPQATLCALRGAREEQASGLRAAAAAWADADHMRVIGLRAWVLNDLVRTFPSEHDRLLEVAEVTPAALHRVLEQVPQKILAARKESARVFEAPLVRRVNAALSLLASPTIRGAVPEAPALRPRAMRLAKVSTQLAAVAARVEILHRRRERLHTLTRLEARMTDGPEMQRLLRWESERLSSAISELDARAGMLIYPEAGVTEPTSVDAALVAAVAAGAAVSDSVYGLDTGALDETGQDLDPREPGLIDRLQDLNLRVLTDLASLTDRIERGLKLEAMEPSVTPDVLTRRSVA